MTETLIDRAAERRVEKPNPSRVTDIVSEVRVTDFRLQYKKLDSDCWNESIRIEELQNMSIDEVEDNIESAVLSGECRDKVLELKKSVVTAYDSEDDVYSVVPRFNDKGQVESLVVPLSSPLTDDFVVQEFYDEKGDFNAEEVEEQLQDEIHKIRTENLYIDSLNKDTYEVKTRENISTFESINEKASELPQADNNIGEILFTGGIMGIGAILTWGIPMFVSIYSPIAGTALFLFLCLFELLPFLCLIGFFISVFDALRATLMGVMDKDRRKYETLFEA